MLPELVYHVDDFLNIPLTHLLFIWIRAALFLGSFLYSLAAWIHGEILCTLNYSFGSIDNFVILVLRPCRVTKSRDVYWTLTWFCSCESFQILLSTSEMNFGSNDFDGLKCLHCHVFDKMVDIVSWLGYCLLSKNFLKVSSILFSHHETSSRNVEWK